MILVGDDVDAEEDERDGQRGADVAQTTITVLFSWQVAFVLSIPSSLRLETLRNRHVSSFSAGQFYNLRLGPLMAGQSGKYSAQPL
jgi:hypothetical protein